MHPGPAERDAEAGRDAEEGRDAEGGRAAAEGGRDPEGGGLVGPAFDRLVKLSWRVDPRPRCCPRAN